MVNFIPQWIAERIYGDPEIPINLLASRLIPWSVLARIGRSSVMRLTVFAPFVGYYIIFNENIWHYLQLNASVLGFEAVGGEQFQEYITRNSYYTYFGLFSLGVASLIFGFFCPRAVQNSVDEVAHAMKFEFVEAPAIIRSKFIYIVEKYYTKNHPMHYVERLNWPDYPNEVSEQFSSLFLDMIKKFDGEIPDQLESDPENASVLSNWREIVSASGYANIDGIVDIVYRRSADTSAFSYEFIAQSQKFSKDICFVEYRTMDYENYVFRAICALLYTIGFLLLSIPSVTVFGRIIRSFF